MISNSHDDKIVIIIMIFLKRESNIELIMGKIS